MQAGLAWIAALLLGVCTLAPSAAAQGGVGDFRARMEKWVETRRILSEEKADWAVEQEALRDTRKLLQQEKEALAAQVAELQESETAADEERRELLLLRGEYQRAAGALETRIRALEEQVLALSPRLPAPLQQKLELLLVQIPEAPEGTSLGLGQRLMNVLGVLAQAEKWNGTATFVGETRSVNGSEKGQVRTLYWGLGQAIFVDARGEIAGIGRPGSDGWEFTVEPALASDARLLLDIYEGNVDVIDFVPMPVEIR
jgi:hypothetical protein